MKEEKRFIGVSILCIVYNHEKFLRDCLEGFVCQETDFPFEILVHDDNSSDHSADIIREYADQYPDLVRPIYEEENQYSQGLRAIGIMEQIMMPKARGRYCAVCEGDDSWCDPHKLQRQFEYMEAHPECSLCTHNTRFHYLNNEYPDFLFNDWEGLHVLTDQEIIHYISTVHFSSFFFRKNQVAYSQYRWSNSYWFEDYIILVSSNLYGDVVCLPGVMSVYNAENPDSLTGTVKNKGYTCYIRETSILLDFLSRFDQATNGRYHPAVQDKMNSVNAEIEYHSLMMQLKKLISTHAGKREVCACADQLAQNRLMLYYDKKKSGIRKLIFRFRMYGHRYCFPLWKKLVEIHVLPKVKE